MSTALKCGCSVSDDGSWVFGDVCREKNCGECRLLASLHPFTKARLSDLMFTGVKTL